MIRGIDSDNYDGVVPVEHFRRLHDLYGVRFNIIGLEAQMPYAQSQRDNCHAAGIETPFAYKFLYWQANDLERMKQAAGFGLPVAIDCEYAVPVAWTPERVVERIAQARDVLLAEGRYWGVYSGAWWWPSGTRNSTLFSGDRLWHAAYPFGQGVVPPQSYLPPNLNVSYGGWTRCTVHQYADACYEDEAGPWAFDMNAADESLLVPAAPANAALTPEEVARCLACISAGEFTRRRWDYNDLLPEDKAAIKQIAAQIR